MVPVYGTMRMMRRALAPPLSGEEQLTAGSVDTARLQRPPPRLQPLCLPLKLLWIVGGKLFWPLIPGLGGSL